jgi:hypothetical protein
MMMEGEEDFSTRRYKNSESVLLFTSNRKNKIKD